MRTVVKFNISRSLGQSFFSNMGLISILTIFMIEWKNGEALKSESAISSLAMIYFVFFSVNNKTYHAMTNVQSFLAIL